MDMNVNGVVNIMNNINNNKLNMRLSEYDKTKIQQLKEIHGFEQTSDLIRYLLTKELDLNNKKNNNNE